MYALTLLQNAAFQIMSFMMNWSLSNFAKNTKNFIGDVGTVAVIILGAIMVIVALVKLATGLLSHGKKQTEWVPIIVLFVVGVMFIAGGSLVGTLTSGAKNSAGSVINDKLNTLGAGTYQKENWNNID